MKKLASRLIDIIATASIKLAIIIKPKRLLSWSINITAWSIFSASLVLAGIELSDRLDEKYPPKPNPPIMQRIDEMQGLTPVMKQNALRRLSKMGTDSVEIIIKKAGF